MKRSYLSFIILFCLLLNQLLKADITNNSSESVDVQFIPNSRLILQPLLLTEELTIDGVLESAWSHYACFKNFTEYQPAENRKPEVQTQGYVAYNAENLYVSFVCYEPDPTKLRASLSERDKIFDDDWVCVSIDPDNEQQKAYQFYVNARGIQGDELWQANGTEDQSFDLVWQSEAKMYPDRWIVELKIPFKSLRFPQREEQQWLVHFIRHYPRENQYKFSWMPISANNNSFMGQGGTLQFHLPAIQSESRTIEILPYAIGTQSSYRIQDETEGEIGNWKREESAARAGVGLKYSLSTSMVADVTYNPDFSQIESDAGQISINFPFALFYDEKRPFFQEGNDIYVVDQNSVGVAIDQFVNLFYSRGINDPLLAGKFSGKFKRVSFGYTGAYDRNTPFLIPFEERTAVLATTRDSYNHIVRGKYDLGNQSSLGLMFTNRTLVGNGYNSVATLDGTFRLSDKYNFSAISAYTFSKEPVDPLLSARLGNGRFEVGDAEKTAAFDGESFNGILWRAKINRNSRHWISTLAYEDFSPGFRADNGFIQANNFRMAEFINGYFFRFDESPVLTYIRPRLDIWRKYNYDGICKDTGMRINLLTSFRQQTLVTLAFFIFNRENLYGKQFDDAHSVWLAINNNTFHSVSGYFFIRMGKEINRLGEKGNVNNPFEIVPTYTLNWTLIFKPHPQLTDQLDFQHYNLWKTFWEGKINGQQIWRNSLSYQFNKNMHIRLIMEYNVVDYYDSYLQQLVRQRYFTVDPLFSYKLNAFSVFYLGGKFGGQNNYYLNWDEVRFTNQSVFIKLQYQFRS
jgi:hypothetical protein